MLRHPYVRICASICVGIFRHEVMHVHVRCCVQTRFMHADVCGCARARAYFLKYNYFHPLGVYVRGGMDMGMGTDRRTCMCIDMCTDICIEVCLDMCAEVRVWGHVCTETCV